MAQHLLSLDVPDTMNLGILRVVDTSVYNTLVPVVCPLLEVTLPGFNYSVQFTEPIASPGFMLNLTACDFGTQTSQCGTVLSDLADGIYIIKYSVSPNSTVYVEYNHLRITNALTRYQSLLCDIDLGVCDPPESIKQKLNRLRLIRMYLDAAKAKVEYCHNPEKGMQLYNYAIKLLDKMKCITCK
jgi:hypothetical protein